MPRPKRSSSRRPFRVFEAGSGRVPTGLIRRAARSKKRGLRQRLFTGVDVQKPNIREALKRARVSRKPVNVKLIQGHALAELQKLSRESQDLIFESFVLGNLKEGEKFLGVEGDREFFRLAWNALRPGGRLVLVQTHEYAQTLRSIVDQLGFGFHAVPIPSKKALKSDSWAIRLRATPKLREKRLNRQRGSSLFGFDLFADLFGDNATRVESDFTPTIILLQKPRSKSVIHSFSEAGVHSGFAGLSDAERRIVEDILENRGDAFH